MKHLHYIFILLLLGSCIPKESAIAPRIPGDEKKATISLGSDYSIQAYYDFGTNSVVSKNELMAWDIALNSASGKYEIVLNTGRFMKVKKLGNIDWDKYSFSDVDDIGADEWSYDTPSGNIDSTAIGQWWELTPSIVSKQDIYLISRSPSGDYALLKILSVEKNSIKISFKDLDNNETYQSEIIKIPNTNFSCFSFENGGKNVKIEPDKSQWDIVFTRHTELLFTSDKQPMWYGVTSVLLNPNGVIGKKITDTKFKDIDFNVVQNSTLLPNRNIIGHDWKSYDIEKGAYTVHSDKVYIIKSTENDIYKLSFTDFYNDKGEKGFPKFEFQKL